MLHALPLFLLLFARALARPPSREKRLETETLLTLLSSHISLTRTFRERIFRPRGACPRAAIGTSNGPAPELCDAFNFIYTAAGYIPSTERWMCVRACVCSRDTVSAVRAISPIHVRQEKLSIAQMLFPPSSRKDFVIIQPNSPT